MAPTGTPAQSSATTEKATTSSDKDQAVAGVTNEFEPPLACIRRILKNSLPKSTNVGKDASLAFSRACGIFCIYLATCANDFARESKRQTITAKDVLSAIKELDFEEFTPQLEQFLLEHRKDEKRKKDAKAKAAAEKDSADVETEEIVPGEEQEGALDMDEDDDETEDDSKPSLTGPSAVFGNDDEDLMQSDDEDDEQASEKDAEDINSEDSGDIDEG
jgi:DNA polymerase epsilon subunit 3